MVFVSVKFDLCLTVASHFFFVGTKILSEGPYLKSFISRVRTKHRECFHSLGATVIRLLAEPFFLVALNRAVCRKTVNAFNSNR